MPKGQTTIDTPTATMVLRGTNVKVLTDGGNTLLVVDEGSVKVHNKQTGQDTIVEEGGSLQISSTGFGATDAHDTGDPAVDDGITTRAKKSGNMGTPEQRRSGDRAAPSRSNGNNRSSGGGNSGPSGGTSPG
jgi:hypothetical protein